MSIQLNGWKKYVAIVAAIIPLLVGGLIWGGQQDSTVRQLRKDFDRHVDVAEQTTKEFRSLQTDVAVIRKTLEFLVNSQNPADPRMRSWKQEILEDLKADSAKGH